MAPIPFWSRASASSAMHRRRQLRKAASLIARARYCGRRTWGASGRACAARWARLRETCATHAFAGAWPAGSLLSLTVGYGRRQDAFRPSFRGSRWCSVRFACAIVVDRGSFSLRFPLSFSFASLCPLASSVRCLPPCRTAAPSPRRLASLPSTVLHCGLSRWPCFAPWVPPVEFPCLHVVSSVGAWVVLSLPSSGIYNI